MVCGNKYGHHQGNEPAALMLPEHEINKRPGHKRQCEAGYAIDGNKHQAQKQQPLPWPRHFQTSGIALRKLILFFDRSALARALRPCGERSACIPIPSPPRIVPMNSS